MRAYGKAKWDAEKRENRWESISDARSIDRSKLFLKLEFRVTGARETLMLRDATRQHGQRARLHERVRADVPQRWRTMRPSLELHLGRRAALVAALACAHPLPRRASAAGKVSSGMPELSNSIVASRDTNVSPKEIYDFLRSKAELRPVGEQRRALDLGAGAGVSTQVLFDIGWQDIVAVDPSRVAWDKYVAASESLPAGIKFEHASDEQYVARRSSEDGRFDLVTHRRTREPCLNIMARTPTHPHVNTQVIVNYAMNHEKAVRYALQLLAPGGKLLAPTNLQENYWFKQQYELLDEKGEVLWSKGTLWSYDVLFQPDFTSPSCQGQWCPSFRTDDAVKGLVL